MEIEMLEWIYDVRLKHLLEDYIQQGSTEDTPFTRASSNKLVRNPSVMIAMQAPEILEQGHVFCSKELYAS